MLDIRQRTGYLFLAVMVGHVILISAQVPTQSGVKVLEAVTFGVFSQVQRGGASLTGGVRNLWRHYVGLRGATLENEELRRRVADLEVRLQEQRALAQETVKLQKLLDLRAKVPLQTITASIIAGAAAPDGVLTVTIDKGTADGVLRDMAVIAPGGIVGRVFLEPAAHAARVQLLIGLNAGAGAMLERSRAGGVVVGNGGKDDPPLVMEHVSNLADVKPGDLVVTSGLDGIYPKGFPIGTVESAQRGASLYQIITVRPSTDFSNLEEVLVVLNPPAKDDGGSS